MAWRRSCWRYTLTARGVATQVVRREPEHAGEHEQHDGVAPSGTSSLMMLWSRMRCWMSGSSPISTWAMIENTNVGDDPYAL